MGSGLLAVIGCDGGSESALKEVVRSAGYRAESAPSAAAASVEAAAANGAGRRAVFVPPGDDAGAEQRAAREILERAPGARVVLVSSDGDMGAVARAVARSERLLVVPRGEGLSAHLEEIRQFIAGAPGGGATVQSGEPGGHVFFLGRNGPLNRYAGEIAAKLRAFVKPLTGIPDLRDMLRVALRGFLDIVGCEAGSIYLWDQVAGELILRAAEGPEKRARLGVRQRLGDGVAGWAAESRQAILITDTRQVPRLKGRPSRRYGNFSCLAAPILHGDQLFGVVCLTMPKGDRPFQPDDLRLTQELADRLGSLMHPLRFIAELRDFNEKISMLARSCSDLVMERDTAVQAMNTFSTQLLDGIPVGVVACDGDLRVRFANAVARRFLGADPAGPTTSGRVPLEDGLDLPPGDWRRRLRGVMESAKEMRLTRQPHRSGEGQRLLDVRCSPLREADGRVGGVIVMFQDVTEEAEREEQLALAQRLTLMGRMAAKVAHELNNPLDGILRFVNLAERLMQTDPDKAKTYLGDCRRGLQRMGSILGELLMFSRSRFKPERRRSLSEVIREAMSHYEDRAQETGVDVRLDVPDGLPAVFDGELCGVVGNVIKNALDAMGHGGELALKAEQQNGFVRLTVSDTGPGVPDEVKDKIFEPFFTTKPEGAGTGLGLAWCRDVLGKMGGLVRLCPSEKGACFEIIIPVGDPQEREGP